MWVRPLCEVPNLALGLIIRLMFRPDSGTPYNGRRYNKTSPASTSKHFLIDLGTSKKTRLPVVLGAGSSTQSMFALGICLPRIAQSETTALCQLTSSHWKNKPLSNSSNGRGPSRSRSASRRDFLRSCIHVVLNNQVATVVRNVEESYSKVHLPIIICWR